VRAVADRYDIVECHQGDLPMSKRWLGLKGVLVVRSSGLFHAYRDFLRHASVAWPDQPHGARVGNVVRALEWRSRLRRTERTFAEADVINVPNEDERAIVRGMVSDPDKVIVIPNGIASGTLSALRVASEDARARQGAQRVVVVGTWDVRKGAREWPAIIRHVWTELSDTRFAFLGTRVTRDQILGELGCGDDSRIEVVPTFAADALPELLARSTVGALPSHIEGFGLGLVESLAAGIPSVAYDVPGPRETVGRLRRAWLTPAGDPKAFSSAIVELLRLSPESYARDAQECTNFAQRYSWQMLAPQTLDAYLEITGLSRR